MGCNCGKSRAAAAPRRVESSGTTQTFSLLVGSTEETFGSRLEADAANARSGYAGIVKPVGA